MIENYENIKNNINVLSNIFDFKENSELFELCEKIRN